MFYLKKNGILYKIAGRIQSLMASAIGFTPPSGMSATDVQGAIDEVFQRVNSYTATNSVYLTVQSPYTCPKDGYLVVNLGAADAQSCNITLTLGTGGSIAFGYLNTVSQYGIYPLYLKKGMTVRVDSMSASASVNFISL